MPINPLDPNEPTSVARHRKRLTRKVREAYLRMEYWEKVHKRRMDELLVFTLRFPRKKGDKGDEGLTATGRTPSKPELQNIPQVPKWGS